MTDDLQPEPAPEPKPQAARKPRAPKSKAEKPATGKPKTAPKKRKSKAESAAPAPAPSDTPARAPIEDPIGDTTDGEARFATDPIPEPEAHAEMKAFREETADEAEDVPALAGAAGHEETISSDEPEEIEPVQPRPEPKLERLQKILSQAGIASRRRAEEMIVAGRVVVNGQVVNTLGSKADPARDHIRVDGKLLHGAERHRYFMLNKPKGYVTTVSDPEGRPTVMEFFSKLSERLYPVGRLDYQSEGLLLMTNDGELANSLTRAASGIEKTYLVKVAGQPTEEELDTLRSGVVIDSEKAGSRKVRTAPARIRQVRQGDNPWYEVVLIEGRNRELRKMFSSVGHFVEKIRRVGYGPLVLDLEPGNLRELNAEEVAALRLAAEGKLKPRPVKAAPMLPKEAGRPAQQRAPDRPSGDRRSGKSFARTERPFRPKPAAPAKSEWKPRREGFAGGQTSRAAGRNQRPERSTGSRFERPPFPARPRREQDESRPGESRFDQPGRKPFAPRGQASEFARPHAPGRKFDRPPESGLRKSPAKTFGGPAKSWNKRPGSRPFRGEGAAQPFREPPRRDSGSRREEGSTSRPKRSFGSKPGGFSKPGFKRGPGGHKRSGQRPGPRPGGKKRG